MLSVLLIACMGMLEWTSVCRPLRAQLLGLLALQAVNDDKDPGDGAEARPRTVRVAAVGSTLKPPERVDHTLCSMLGLKQTHCVIKIESTIGRWPQR